MTKKFYDATKTNYIAAMDTLHAPAPSRGGGMGGGSQVRRLARTFPGRKWISSTPVYLEIPERLNGQEI